MTKKDLQQALPRFTQFVRRFGPLLEDDTRVTRAEAYLRGLLLDADDNKNAETIALNAYANSRRTRSLGWLVRAVATWPAQAADPRFLGALARVLFGPGGRA